MCFAPPSFLLSQVREVIPEPKPKRHSWLSRGWQFFLDQLYGR